MTGIRPLVLGLLVLSSFATEEIRVDFSQRLGNFRPLNGVNKGPEVAGGLLDLSPDWARLKIPLTRLHDCHWPNPDVVDIHAVFPRAEADPANEESFDFLRTDRYIAAIKETGSQVIYRLGESIEHTQDKRFVHPPVDPVKWAKICLGIIIHYNHGWANGHRWGIKYWEIWNEPENRPVMWTGTDEQYFELYRTAARMIKEAYSELQVGGPGIGNSGTVQGKDFIPSAFLVRFLETCRAEKLPLDFFSWHCYTASPEELVIRAKGIRALLDQFGFVHTESHLNEWNYLPDNDWKPVMRGATAVERASFYRRMAGAEGAAFFGAAFVLLHEAPLDAAALFHGEAGAFGLFDEHGVPNDVYRAFLMVAQLASGQRVKVESNGAISATASVNQGQDGYLFLVNSGKTLREVRVVPVFPGAGPRWQATMQYDLTRSFEIGLPDAPLTLQISGESLRLIRFTRK